MRTFKLKVLYFLATVSIFSCGDKDPGPAMPEAYFGIGAIRKVEGGYPVFDFTDIIHMRNDSKNAVRYEWDFGDGSTSTIISPNHKYEKKGYYTITLVAYNELGDKSTYSREIKVGYRFMTQLLITSSAITLPAQKFLFIGESDNLQNAFVFQLPSGHTLPMGGPVNLGEFNGSNWFLMLIEDKHPYGIFDTNDTLVFGAVFNPATINPPDYTADEGRIIISETKNHLGETTNDFSFQIDFKL
ncbi:hypothetical protein C900_04948 [Fulvivirga imtechensis AK7]|uniref:PKD domain-containing protein n=1 Tax=Fulvivirga imtechensis AK7 TaxID=1237149 RepID=L8JKH0_9BACT|nr:PKD domain-containing protein [Fulvivirga imtechensis]ELR69416.1 hypothetical protein C900_04948 [Fulvivirga imtechensis AK7]